MVLSIGTIVSLVDSTQPTKYKPLCMSVAIRPRQGNVTHAIGVFRWSHFYYQVTFYYTAKLSSGKTFMFDSTVNVFP